MKRIMPVALLVCALSLGIGTKERTSDDQPEPFGQGRAVQVGVVVNDIEKASAAYADWLGVAVPKWSWTEAEDKAHTQYKAKASPARAKLAFIELKNITLELIEPDQHPSTWRDSLNTKGEGVHHIAFGQVCALV